MALHQTTPLEIDGSAMTALAEKAPPAAESRGTALSISTPFFALAVGLLAVNLTSAQPLIGIIAPAIQLPAGAYGLVSMLILLGYAAGLILLVPLTDLFENRRLILGMFAGNVASLALAASARQSRHSMASPPSPWPTSQRIVITHTPRIASIPTQRIETPPAPLATAGVWEAPSPSLRSGRRG